MTHLRRVLPAPLIAVLAVLTACAPPAPAPLLPAPTTANAAPTTTTATTAPPAASNPIGRIDTVAVTAGAVQLTGWALDPDTTTSIEVEFTIDGRLVSRANAQLNRPDVDAVHKRGPLHGFDETITLDVEDRLVCVTAVKRGTQSTPLGCRSVSTGAASPGGFVDSGRFPAAGYTVRIHPNASHFAADIHWAASQVSQHTKVPLTFGAPATGFDPDFDAREIIVHVGHACGGNSVGCARTWWGADSKLIVGSSVSVVDSYTRHPLTRALLLHEFSHSMGLDHFTANYNGQRQIMHTNLDYQVTALQAGDIGGLMETAAVGRRREVDRSPRGALESVTPVVGGVRVIGWAADLDLGVGAANIEITVDGVRAVGPIAARVHRPDVAAAHAPFGSHHGYNTTVPAAPGVRRVCVIAHNASWGSDTTLGCVNVTVGAAAQRSVGIAEVVEPSTDPVIEVVLYDAEPLFVDPAGAPSSAAVVPAAAPPPDQLVAAALNGTRSQPPPMRPRALSFGPAARCGCRSARQGSCCSNSTDLIRADRTSDN